MHAHFANVAHCMLATCKANIRNNAFALLLSHHIFHIQAELHLDKVEGNNRFFYCLNFLNLKI